MKKLPDGPKTPKLLQQLHSLADPLGYLEAAAREPYGDIFQANTLGLSVAAGFSGPLIFVSHPQALQQIFMNPKQFTSPGELNGFMRPFVGDYGLVTASGSSHKRQRKLLMPPFHGARMHFYGEIMCNQASLAIGQLKMGQIFSASTAMQELSLQIILETIFGVKQRERAELLKQSLKNLSEIFDSPLTSIWMFFPILQKDLGPLTSWGYFCREMHQVDEIIYTEIRERRQQPDPSRTDILSLLIATQDEAGQAMDDVELRDQLMTLLIAGKESASTAMTWALYWIHHLPEVGKKLLAELDTLEENPEPMSIVKLPYLTAFCNEVLRIYPSIITLFPRVVQEEVELLGYSLPPGKVLIPCVYLTHHREDLYPEPKQFKPERFLERKYSNYEFLPFGGGSRRCIGDAFSIYEMKLVLATILSNYKLELAEEKPVKPQRRGVNITPAGDVKMVMKGQRSRQATPLAAAL